MKILILFICFFAISACSFGGTSIEKDNSSKITQAIASPTFGSGEKKVDLYIDYKCPGCMIFSQDIIPLLEAYARDGKLQITYKYPSFYPESLSRYSDTQAIICAHSLGKFQEYKRAIPIARPSMKSENILLEKYLEVAKNLSLPILEFEECMTKEKFYPLMMADLQDLEKLGATSLPTVAIDGEIIDKRIYQDREGFRVFLIERYGPIFLKDQESPEAYYFGKDQR